MSFSASISITRTSLRQHHLPAGFAVSGGLWDNRILVHDLMETVVGFVLFWIALFYALVWFPIRDYVSERLARRTGAKKC